MVNFTENTYILAEHSINHLQSKINDQKAYIKKALKCSLSYLQYIQMITTFKRFNDFN